MIIVMFLAYPCGCSHPQIRELLSVFPSMFCQYFPTPNLHVFMEKLLFLSNLQSLPSWPAHLGWQAH